MKPAVLLILSSIACLLSYSLASCSKGADSNTNTAKTNTQLITQNTWKVKTVGLDNNKDGVAESDATSLVPACKFDNIYTFKADGTGSMDEGAAKCNSTDAQTQSFTWVFKNNEKVLSGTFSFTNSDASILSMNDNNMIVSGDNDFGTGTNYHLIVTFQH